MNFYNQNNKI